MQNGILLQVVPYREFDMSFLAREATQEIILQNELPITPYTVIGLSVRVHECRIQEGASFQFILRGVNPSPEDGRDFVLVEDLGSTPEINSSTKAPVLLALDSAIVNPQTPSLRVVLKATGPEKRGPVWGIFSADLVMKTG